MGYIVAWSVSGRPGLSVIPGADVRIRIRGGVIRIRIRKAGIRAVIRIPAKEHAPGLTAVYRGVTRRSSGYRWRASLRGAGRRSAALSGRARI